jgi:hypothetical protein
MFQKLLGFLARIFDSSVFVVTLVDGCAHATKGQVPPGFLSDIAEFARNNGLTKGTIRGRRVDGNMRVFFSDDIPEEAHQRLRNVWHLYSARFKDSY